MAKSYPKQSTQRSAMVAVEWPRSALSVFSLLVSMLALMLASQNQPQPHAAAALLAAGGGHPSPVAEARSMDEALAGTEAEQRDARVQALTDFLSKRYRVSREAMGEFVATAFSAGRLTRTDPLLILAVIAVESRFNPIAESVMGAKGLMQVIPKHHPDKLRTAAGELDVLDPETNILAGARILREYIAEAGDLPVALRRYGGGVSDVENQYAAKVMNERLRLEQVMRVAQARPSQPARPATQDAATLL